jgi:peptidyl-tRNA hydrolase
MVIRMKWNQEDEEFKKILELHNDMGNEKLIVSTTSKELTLHIKKTECWKGLPSAIIRRLKEAKTFYSFNIVLDMIYNYADSNGIWLGF